MNKKETKNKKRRKDSHEFLLFLCQIFFMLFEKIYWFKFNKIFVQIEENFFNCIYTIVHWKEVMILRKISFAYKIKHFPFYCSCLSKKVSSCNFFALGDHLKNENERGRIAISFYIRLLWLLHFAIGL